jgi:hypothetical protein
MADRHNDIPEMPDNWGEYSRMLGDLPLRSLPQGADGRLQSRLATATSPTRPRRPWLAAGLSLVGCIIAVVVGLSVYSDRQEMAPQTKAVPTVAQEKKHRTTRRHPPAARPQVAPHMSETPVTIDTTPPHDLPIPQPRQSEPTTGGDARDTRRTP